jgi:hypothetical protein
MKPIFPRLAASFSIAILLAACNLPQGITNTPDLGTVSTKVALTLVALTQLAQQVPITSPGSPISEQPVNTQNPTLTETTEPTYTQTPTQLPTGTIAPTNTPLSAPGTVAGSISGYPYGALPSLAIVAYGQEPPYYYSYMITGAGQTYFEMTTSYLLPGHYQVVAYDSSGHAGGCNFNVMVVSNQTVNCDITNWGGSYRAKPSGVPNP